MEKAEKFFRIFGRNVTDDILGDSSDTKAGIILEAASLFAERGFDQISIRDIADAVGIQGSSIYNHFVGKKALLDTIMVLVEDLYFHFLAAMKEKARGAKSFPEGLEAVVADPRTDLSKFSCYVISLIHCEKYRNMKSARIYTDIFMDYSITAIKDIFSTYVQQGLARPFDVNMSAVIVNNMFHTSVSMLMQEYLGLQPHCDLRPIRDGLKKFLLDLAQTPSSTVWTEVLRPMTTPPFLDEVLALQKSTDRPAELGRAAETGREVEGKVADSGPNLVLEERLEGYLKIYEAQFELLPRLGLGCEAEKVFKSFCDDYLESAVTADDDPDGNPDVAKLISREVDRWRSSKAKASEMFKSSDALGKRITEMIRKAASFLKTRTDGGDGLLPAAEGGDEADSLVLSVDSFGHVASGEGFVPSAAAAEMAEPARPSLTADGEKGAAQSALKTEGAAVSCPGWKALESVVSGRLIVAGEDERTPATLEMADEQTVRSRKRKVGSGEGGSRRSVKATNGPSQPENPGDRPSAKILRDRTSQRAKAAEEDGPIVKRRLSAQGRGR
ncbi:MAG: TetR/AcrR family transcriptional regulator [Deltaproteobacteria bacterium]|jgi:AcrR family transcriptional regulator|nr:TetR/AcrR family transcriptional regulator [Deltaproteobacteria bacterium]